MFEYQFMCSIAGDHIVVLTEVTSDQNRGRSQIRGANRRIHPDVEVVQFQEGRCETNYYPLQNMPQNDCYQRKQNHKIIPALRTAPVPSEECIKLYKK